jgi:hypothetical protein
MTAFYSATISIRVPSKTASSRAIPLLGRCESAEPWVPVATIRGTIYCISCQPSEAGSFQKLLIAYQHVKTTPSAEDVQSFAFYLLQLCNDPTPRLTQTHGTRGHRGDQESPASASRTLQINSTGRKYVRGRRILADKSVLGRLNDTPPVIPVIARLQHVSSRINALSLELALRVQVVEAVEDPWLGFLRLLSRLGIRGLGGTGGVCISRFGRWCIFGSWSARLTRSSRGFGGCGVFEHPRDQHVLRVTGTPAATRG